MAAPLTRLTAAIEVFLCSGIPTQLAIQTVLVWAAGWTIDGTDLELFPLVTLVVADTVLLVTLMVILLRTHGESVRGLWLGSRSFVREALVGLAYVPVVLLIAVVLLNVLRLAAPWLHDVTLNPFEPLASSPDPVNAAVLTATVAIGGGVREEMQRAFQLHRFERHLGGALVGVIAWNAAFGLLHAPQGSDAVITTGVLGVFWSLVYLRRRSAVAPIVSHAGFNAIQVVSAAALGA
jgi:membrane protease YdiL (CAAX protease family)